MTDSGLRNWLRTRWWLPLVATFALAGVIYVLAPRYTDAQVAPNARAFLAAVADAGDGRTIAAGLVDIAFVAAYVATALALSRPNAVSRAGLVVMVVAGAADVVENGLVVLGVTRGADVTDGLVDAVRAFGAVKWLGVVVGGALILAGLVVDRRGQGAQPAS